MPIDALASQVKDHPNKIYLRQPINQVYTQYTWEEVYDKVLRLANGLLATGLKQGDRVALISTNSAEWFISDFAMLAAGLIPTPIYATAGSDTISYVLEHSEAKAIFIGGVEDHEMVTQAIPKSVQTIAMFNGPKGTDHTLADLVERHDRLENIFSPNKEDTFSIVYTSGSTGKPKGVVLTYANVGYTGAMSVALFDKGVDERLLSYLPLAHVTERGLIEYNSIYGGATVSFTEGLDTFIDDLRNAEVTSFISVPRLWVKFQSQVLAAIPEDKLNRLLKIPFVSSVVKKRIRRQLGLDNSLSCGCGSAPIAPAVLNWFRKIGIEIAEGWGMSETIGLATTNYPFRGDKIGTIGKPCDGFDVRISDIGEIQIKGDGVFREYYKRPDITEETFTKDGYLKTGDKGELDADGYLSITGRVKDIFKSGKGKYVVPVPIEAKLGENLLIEQICVMGSGLPAAMAVIVLSQEVSEGMTKEKIEASLTETLDAVNARIEKHEFVGGIRIVNEEWSIENGLLTPTLKIKRAELEEKYLPVIEGQKDKIVWE